MNITAGVLYSVLIGTCLVMNKYVLSTLGFRYPTIFQGWQMLVGFIIFRLLICLYKNSFSVISLDRSGFISLLPAFLFFTTSIISGSKALSSIPIPIFISCYNIIPALISLLDFAVPSRPPVAPLQTVASVVSIITGSCLIIGQVGLTFDDSAYFWLVVGIITTLAHTLYSRIADARYTSRDRLYFSFLFSLITLAPASVYLEEAFAALNFHHDRQEMFVIGSMISAVLGTTASLYSTRLKQDEYFGPICHLALACTALLSPLLFSMDLAWWQWLLVSVNVVSTIPIPSHVAKEDEEPLLNGSVLSF